MTDADHGRVYVAVTAVVVLRCVQAVRAQYVVRALGLAVVGGCGRRIGPGAGAAGPAAAAAADWPAGPVTAAGPILVLAPCGLGLIPPINFVVQIFVFVKGQATYERERAGEREWMRVRVRVMGCKDDLINLLRDTWPDRFSMLPHSFRNPARSWRIGCLRR